jgi:hypothetical protein
LQQFPLPALSTPNSFCSQQLLLPVVAAPSSCHSQQLPLPAVMLPVVTLPANTFSAILLPTVWQLMQLLCYALLFNRYRYGLSYLMHCYLNTLLTTALVFSKVAAPSV